MKELWNVIQIGLAAAGAWLGWFLGGMDGLIYAMIVFVIADYATGVLCAVSDRRLSSEIGFKGICKKVLIFVLIGVANLIDIYIIKSGSMLRTATIFFYLSNEGISLLENAAHLGLPVPQKIKDLLKQLNDKSKKGE